MGAVLARTRAQPLRLCVPGHGGGAYAPGGLARALRRHGVWQLDWTEVAGLDDLAWPQGPIRDAESALAEAFGAAGAAILVGGSTAGILAALLAFAAGRTVAMAPGQHRSVYAALALASAEPLFLPEWVDRATGLALGPSPRAAAARIAGARPAVVVVAHPTYQGVAAPLAPLVAAAHATGALVVADSAHGAHFGLDPRLPTPALAAGADIAVLGLHKSLGALTQTAVVAWRQGVDGDRLRAALRLVQSSSPSYLLMASADAARASLVRSGRMRWRHAIDRAEGVRRAIGDDLWQPPARQDPTRVVWRSPAGDGASLLGALREAGIEAEYADERTALLLCGPNVAARHMERLLQALARARETVLRAGRSGPRPALARAAPLSAPAQGAMLAALSAPWEEVPLAAAEGRVAADFLVPYPPGVPMALPGARLDGATVARLQTAVSTGREVQGVRRGSTIRVVRTEGGPSP